MDGPNLLKRRARALMLVRVGSTFAPSIPHAGHRASRSLKRWRSSRAA
jgi:hypothetical protein